MKRSHAFCQWGLLAVACTSVATAQLGFAQTRSVPVQADDSTYDQVVEDFIQFDIGNVRDPFAVERIKSRFNSLKGDAAVPALVRGLNRATRMRASCPITALCGKLRGILGVSKDPEVGTYVLENLEQRNVGGYTHHINGVFDLAEKQIVRVKGKEYMDQQFGRRAEEDQQRLAYVPGRKLTDLATRDPGAARVAGEESPRANGSSDRRAAASQLNGRRSPAPSSASPSSTADLRTLSIPELAERLIGRAAQTRVLDELYRRASSSAASDVAEQAEAIVKVLKEGEDDAARESAARLLGLLRIEQAVPQLIDALEDASPQVRSAASTALARTARQLFGPSDNATEAERRQAIARWRDWLKLQEKNVER